jgi:peptidoglycan/xylan/chitin deacetylase (PgdA/CDA1 family)
MVDRGRICYRTPTMRVGHVLRFLAVVFVVGAILGLGGGVVFGGRDGGAAKTVTAEKSPVTTTTSAGLTPSLGRMTAEKARAIGANELGHIPVLMYHKIGLPESRYTRSPQHFREDIAALKAAGFYPITVRDLVEGNIDIPAGKSPVAITFDDSSPNQFRLQDDGTVAPDSAVGIIQQAVAQGGWAQRATFYCLLEVHPPNNILFGQPDLRTQKLQKLLGWGYEVGSHTVSHLDLRRASAKESQKQLYQSQQQLDQRIGNGYRVATLAVPFGSYPKNTTILKQGTWNGNQYAYEGAVAVGGGSSPSPFSDAFHPYRIPRIEMSEGSTSIKPLLDSFAKNPELRYVSDGDPTAISAPRATAGKLGAMIAHPGRPVITY